MPFLRQSTSQVIRFGPFLDITDGVTEETALTLAQADMRLSKDGGAFAQKNAAGNATHDSDGWYSTTLDATDTNTVGELILNVHQPANTLPVWMRWWVIEEAVYDAHYGAAAAGPLQSTTAGRTLDVTATGEAGVNFANIAGTLDAANIGANAITAAKIATDAIGDAQIATGAIAASAFAAGAIDNAAFNVTETLTANPAAGGIVAASFGAGAINAAAIATDAIGAAELAADAVNEIARAIGIQTNTAFSDIEFLMVDSTDHVSPKTGLTVTGQRSIDGGAFGAVSGAIAEVSNGIYQFDALAVDLNGTVITFRFSATGADDTFVTIKTVA